MDSLLVTVATYSRVAAVVFGLLFVVDLLALMIYASRSGKVEPDEGTCCHGEQAARRERFARIGRQWRSRRQILG